MNTLDCFEFTAYIGIDWSDTKHDICIQPAGNDECEFDRIAHQPKSRRSSAYRRMSGYCARIDLCSSASGELAWLIWNAGLCTTPRTIEEIRLPLAAAWLAILRTLGMS